MYHLFLRLGGAIYIKFEGDKSIFSALDALFRCQMCCCVSIPQRIKVDCVENLGQISRFFIPSCENQGMDRQNVRVEVSTSAWDPTSDVISVRAATWAWGFNTLSHFRGSFFCGGAIL